MKSKEEGSVFGKKRGAKRKRECNIIADLLTVYGMLHVCLSVCVVYDGYAYHSREGRIKHSATFFFAKGRGCCSHHIPPAVTAVAP